MKATIMRLLLCSFTLYIVVTFTSCSPTLDVKNEGAVYNYLKSHTFQNVEPSENKSRFLQFNDKMVRITVFSGSERLHSTTLPYKLGLISNNERIIIVEGLNQEWTITGATGFIDINDNGKILAYSPLEGLDNELDNFTSSENSDIENSMTGDTIQMAEDKNINHAAIIDSIYINQNIFVPKINTGSPDIDKIINDQIDYRGVTIDNINQQVIEEFKNNNGGFKINRNSYDVLSLTLYTNGITDINLNFNLRTGKNFVFDDIIKPNLKGKFLMLCDSLFRFKKNEIIERFNGNVDSLRMDFGRKSLLDFKFDDFLLKGRMIVYDSSIVFKNVLSMDYYSPNIDLTVSMQNILPYLQERYLFIFRAEPKPQSNPGYYSPTDNNIQTTYNCPRCGGTGMETSMTGYGMRQSTCSLCFGKGKVNQRIYEQIDR